MSRTVPANDLIEATKQFASEPIIIVKIFWSSGNKFYSSKKLGIGDGSTAANAIGLIMNIENFSEQIKVGNSGKINNLSIDIAGLRSYYDSNILYHTPCIIYQYFWDDSSLTSGIVMFAGWIASPITWNESSDILSFDIISQVEDSEYGFSLNESGSYGYTPDEDAYDVPWPIVFGKCLNVPSIRIQTGATGKVIEPFLRTSTVLEVEGGEDFAQTPTELRLLIGSVVVTGEFDGKQLTLNLINEPRYTTITVAAVPGGDDDEDNFSVIWLTGNYDVKGSFLYSSTLEQYNYCYRQETVGGNTKVWCQNKWGTDASGVWVDTRPITINETAGAVRDSWIRYPENYIFGFIVKADAAVYRINTNGTIHTDSQVKYVAGLYADTVLDVKAYRTIDKKKILCNIPSSYYTKTAEDVGAGFNSSIITMDQLLSSRDKEGWDDDLYVSLDGIQSSNTSILLKWMIDTYSDYSTDSTSFTAGETALTNYPSNFVLFDQGDTMKICEEIAWQCRCSLRISNSIVYLRYLEAEPTVMDAIIDDDDFEIKTTHLVLSDETELITKFIAKWKRSYSPEDKIQTYIKEENSSTYGLIKGEYNFWIYNVKEHVERATTFWAHRYANLWKLLSFDTFTDVINLEAGDSVRLMTTSHDIVSSYLTTLAESVSIDKGLIHLNLWLPVIAGSQTQDANAWDDSVDSLTDIDTSDLREFNYEVELEESEAVSKSSLNRSLDRDDYEDIQEDIVFYASSTTARIFRFIATQDAPAQKFITSTLNYFYTVPGWSSNLYYALTRFVMHTNRLFYCKQAHEADVIVTQPISGSGWTAFWTEMTSPSINFKIKGATNLDDLSEPLVTNDLLYAYYDIATFTWKSVQILYEGGSGSGIQYARISQVVTHAAETEYEMYLIDDAGADISGPYTIDRAIGYEANGTDGTDIRNYMPWYGVGARVPVSQHYDVTAAALKWFIDKTMMFVGKPADRSIDIEEETTASESLLRIMAVWK